MSLERDLVDDCRDVAKHMGAFLAEVGQRRAKGSGTTLGFPDLVLICAGCVKLIELLEKRIELLEKTLRILAATSDSEHAEEEK